MSDDATSGGSEQQADEGAMGGDPDEVLAALLEMLAPAFATLQAHDEPATVHLAAGDARTRRASQ